MDVREAQDVLELAAEATEEDVKQAHRDLARVWHPDRFGEDILYVSSKWGGKYLYRQKKGATRR